MTTDLCSMETETIRSVVIARLTGEIDLSNAGDVEQRIADVADEAQRNAEPGTPIGPIVDLSAIDYLDSAALAAIERVTRRHPIHIVVEPDAVMFRTITIAGLGHLAPMHASIDDAMAAVEASA